MNMTVEEKVDRQFQKIHAIAFGEWLLKEGWCSFKDTDNPFSPIWRKTEWAGFYYVYPESTTPKLYEEFIKNQIKCQN